MPGKPMKRLAPRIALVACLVGVLGFYAGTRFIAGRARVHPVTHRLIAGIATNANWFDREVRDQEEKPEQALRLLEIRRGMVVADVGAGSGYMTLRLAQLVGPTGKVFATDVQPAMLQIVQTKSRAAHASNVEIVQGTETDARLPPDAIDLALLVDVYHEFRYPQAMLRSIRGSLRSRAMLALVEYRKEDPRLPISFTHRMSIDEIRMEVEPEGFVLERIEEALPRQHLVVFRRSGS
jgi:ubiquinone/menaquinone biosynthesis C-methylase UbiE